MTSILPYDIWERVLRKIDGVSVLAFSCVSRGFQEVTRMFLSGKRQEDYWWRASLRELCPEDLELCQSGRFEENWFAVYKSALIQNTIRSRQVKQVSIPLVRRFIKYRTGLHILGDKLVVTQGPLINIYDILTGKHLKTQQIGSYNIHQSFLVRKCGTEMHTTKKSGILPCDVLVFLCGGAQITHLAVTSEHTMLKSSPKVISCEYSAQSNSMDQESFVCRRYSNRVCCDDFTVEIIVHKQSGISLQKLPDCHCYLSSDFRPLSQRRVALELIDKGSRQLSGTLFNTNVAVRLNNPGKIVLQSNREGDTPSIVIPVEGKLWHKAFETSSSTELANRLLNTRLESSYPVELELGLEKVDSVSGPKQISKQDSVRIIHVGNKVVPVLATLQTNEESGKLVVLYTFPLE